jgi:ankyrin repeat domain-containing protein 13
VYKANNLQLVTKTRVEHLNSERAKMFMKELDESELQLKNNAAAVAAAASAGQSNNLPGFLTNFFQGNEQRIKFEKSNSKQLTALEYFQKQTNVDYYLNGCVRGIDETRKVQTFNATLSLADAYPLSLHEQVLPIVDLMALNNSHFKKLKEFITLQLPSGFPVKIGNKAFSLSLSPIEFYDGQLFLFFSCFSCFI